MVNLSDLKNTPAYKSWAKPSKTESFQNKIIQTIGIGSVLQTDDSNCKSQDHQLVKHRYKT